MRSTIVLADIYIERGKKKEIYVGVSDWTLFITKPDPPPEAGSSPRARKICRLIAPTGSTYYIT